MTGFPSYPCNLELFIRFLSTFSEVSNFFCFFSFKIVILRTSLIFFKRRSCNFKAANKVGKYENLMIWIFAECNFELILWSQSMGATNCDV